MRARAPRCATASTTTATARSTRAIPAVARRATTGLLGRLRRRLRQCQGGQPRRASPNARPATPRRCNGHDDDCDGQTDEGTPRGARCSTGVPGVCGRRDDQCASGGASTTSPTRLAGSPRPRPATASTTTATARPTRAIPAAAARATPASRASARPATQHCQGGGLVCVRPTCPPSSETCNGLDDNCNGAIDEPLHRPAARRARPACPASARAGTKVCRGAAPVHVQRDDVSPTHRDLRRPRQRLRRRRSTRATRAAAAPARPASRASARPARPLPERRRWSACSNIQPPTEICNGIDDDCDGSTDEGDPGGGAAAPPATPASAPPASSTASRAACSACRPTRAHAETCNSLGRRLRRHRRRRQPGRRRRLHTGLLGICDAGTSSARAAASSASRTGGGPEACNNLDDNCNGSVDEGNPGGGVACSPAVGVCAPARRVPEPRDRLPGERRRPRPSLRQRPRRELRRQRRRGALRAVHGGEYRRARRPDQES